MYIHMYIRGIDCSTILRLDFGTVLMVWYFLFFILIHHSIGGETSCDIQKCVVHTKLDIYFFICMVVGFISINTINAFGEAYSIQLYMIKFSVTCRRSVVFS